MNDNDEYFDLLVLLRHIVHVCGFARRGVKRIKLWPVYLFWRLDLLTLRFSKFRILCSTITRTWRIGELSATSAATVEGCFSNFAEGILHLQQLKREWGEV